MIIDTHCHIYKNEVKNPDEIIKKAEDSDIYLILNGTDPRSNREVLNLSAKYDNVYAALGYFHTFADYVSREDIALIDRQLSDDKVVAVGEIGLDYYRTKDNKPKQIELFDKMLDLAQNHNLPVIVHSRKAIQDTFDVLKKHDVAGSLHAYSGSCEMARNFSKSGFFIGVGGTVTHKNNKKVKKSIKEVGIESIVLETDSPYLAPEGSEGINTPLNLKYIIEGIACELDLRQSDVVKITTRNARNLFNI